MQSLTTLLQKLEEISEKAAPGPWTHQISWTDEFCHYGSVSAISGTMDPDTARAIVAWRACIKELVEVAKASIDFRAAFEPYINDKERYAQTPLSLALTALAATLESALK